MKILLRQWFAALVVLSLVGTSALAEGKIGTIDLNKAFSNYWKKKEAEANLRDQEVEIGKELKSLEEELKKARDAWQKLVNDSNDQAVSSDERDKRKKMAEEKFKSAKDLDDQAVQYKKQAYGQLQERSQLVRERILGEIKNVVTAKAKAGGYSLVIDIAAQSKDFTPVVLYNNNEFDLTESVLDQLNAAAPGSGSSTAAPKVDEKKKDQKKDAKK
jgi:outer membrane protein